MMEGERRSSSSPQMWRSRAFPLFLGSTTSSSIAGAVSALLIPVLAIETLGASETEVGLVRSVQLLPFLFLGVPLGLLVDRRPRRGLMLGADLARAILLSVIAFLGMTNLLELPTLVALAFALGSFAVVYELSFLSATPDVVGARRLQAANRATEIAQSGAGALGPALAGALAGAWSAAGALLFSAAASLASVVFLTANSWTERHSPEPSRPRHAMWSLTAGVRFVARHDAVRPLVIYLGAKNVFLQAFQTAILLLLLQSLDLGPTLVGAVLAVGAAGFLCGATLSPSLGSLVGIGSVLITSSLVTATGMLLVGVPSTHAVLPAAGSFLVGAGSGLFNIQNISVRQTVTPPETLGRTNAVVKIVSYTAMSLGAFLGGSGSTTTSPSTVIWVCAAGTFFSTLLLLTPAVRKLRTAE